MPAGSPHPLDRLRALAPRLVLGGALLILTVVLVERYIGWGRLLAPWRAQRPEALAAGTGLVLASYAARAVRVYDHFRPATRSHFGACLRLTLLHNLLNNLLPMRLGEASFPALLSRYFAVPVVRGIAGLVWFRLIDLHVLAAAALIALGRDWLSGPALGTVLAAWLVVPWGVYLTRGPSERLLARRPAGRVTHWLNEALAGMPPDTPTFWRSLLWTAVNWGLKLLVFAWLLYAFADTTLGVAVIGALGGELSSVLPVHGLAGAGTYEAGVVAGLAPFGVPAREAFAAAVNLHLFLLGTSLLGGLWALTLPRPHGPR